MERFAGDLEPKSNGLELTSEEAYSLLSLCLCSPVNLTDESEQALAKLADYCRHPKQDGFCQAS